MVSEQFGGPAGIGVAVGRRLDGATAVELRATDNALPDATDGLNTVLLDLEEVATEDERGGMVDEIEDEKLVAVDEGADELGRGLEDGNGLYITKVGKGPFQRIVWMGGVVLQPLS